MSGATASALSVAVATAEEMRRCGRAIGERLRPGDVLLLHGDLGAGKTTLAQGIGAALGVREAIQSPTFTLVGEHAGALPDGTPVRINHLDLYRLSSPDELDSLGYEQYITADDAITLIEWPERAADWLPETYLLISIAYAPPGRRLTVSAHPVASRALRLDDLAPAAGCPAKEREQRAPAAKSA